MKIRFMERACRESLPESPFGVSFPRIIVDGVPDHAGIRGGDRRKHMHDMKVRQIRDEVSRDFERLRPNVPRNRRGRQRIFSETSSWFTPLDNNFDCDS